MVRFAAWVAVAICTVGGSAVKFFVSYSYAFESDSDCGPSDALCGRRFAKPILSLLMLFLGMILVWAVAPCWDGIARRLKSLGAEAAESRGPAVGGLTHDDPLLPGGEADLEAGTSGSVSGGAPAPAPARSRCCPGSWRLSCVLLGLTVLDVVASLCLNASLLFLVPSVVAAMRGVMPLWTLLIQRCLLPLLPPGCVASLREKDDALVTADYVGVALTAAGVASAALVSVAPTLVAGASPASGTGPAATPAEAVAGVVFVLVATLTQAVQFFVEQVLLDDEDDGNLAPQAFVGVEGAFGAVLVAALLAVAQVLPVSADVSAALDGSGVLERTLGPGGSVAFIQQQPALLAVLAGQGLGAFVLCVALFALPALGGGMQMRTFALVGGRGLVLVAMDLIIFAATAGSVGLAPTWWAAGDAVSVLLILAGGFFTGRAQQQREAARKSDS